ncbi:DUF3131 domain-containing protein [Shewanella halifaxensis]|uniref:DUF3131 domain-containing protein n=1 Tax=Shewanella halifaxensis TaxID=271098 RepID=UPI001CBB0A3E|nr:DUF3131 domain-containing protein [Shewanella halifaxensis]
MATTNLYAEDVATKSHIQTFSRGIQQQEVTENSSPIQFQRRAIIPRPPSKIAVPITASVKIVDSLKKSSHQPLTRHEKLLISKAQRYFDKNWNETTGLIDSVQGYSHTTMWDVASGIAGLLALEALAINSQQLTDFRLEKMLNTLLQLPLYKGVLPNRQYNTLTALPSGRMSHTPSNGNGWSALDLGRLYIWFEILKQNKPRLGHKIIILQNRWQLERATKNGNLYGTKLTSSKEYFRQEGRLGYLQYAATGYRLAGLNVDKAFRCENLETTELNGVSLLTDKGNLPFFTSDPYLLYAIEIGYKDSCWNQLKQLYQVHKLNAKSANRLTAYAEDSLSKSPWFLYNNIIYQGVAWQSVSHSGKATSNSQTFSNKAAFAMSVLFNDDYSQQLANLVVSNSARHAVIPTGLYADGKTNTAYNINTNSLILVSLWYKTRAQQAILTLLDNKSLQTDITAHRILDESIKDLKD